MFNVFLQRTHVGSEAFDTILPQLAYKGLWKEVTDYLKTVSDTAMVSEHAIAAIV